MSGVVHPESKFIVGYTVGISQQIFGRNEFLEEKKSQKSHGVQARESTKVKKCGLRHTDI
jgi:hypothetical protein